jgi:hypothetical protein
MSDILHPTHAVFLSVEIAKTKKVNALKDTIKDKIKPKFDHVAVNSPALWKVCS